MADKEEMVPDDFQHDYDERQKELNRKILEKVAEDPDFRGHLLEDPDGALEKAGLAAEAKALDQAGDRRGRRRGRGSLDVAQQVLLALRDPLPLAISRSSPRNAAPQNMPDSRLEKEGSSDGRHTEAGRDGAG